jgi:hypothetical protein
MGISLRAKLPFWPIHKMETLLFYQQALDQVSRANRGMVGRQAREQNREGRGRWVWMHGSHRKE